MVLCPLANMLILNGWARLATCLIVGHSVPKFPNNPRPGAGIPIALYKSMSTADLETQQFDNDRKFFLQGVQGIGALGLLQILVAFALPQMFPLDILKILIGVNQILFVSLIGWYASQLRYAPRWSMAFGVFSLVPVLGFLPAALLYWKSEQVIQISQTSAPIVQSVTLE